MTYHDDLGNHRADRIIIGYEFTQTIAAAINLACDGHTPRVVIDLGGYPIELELVTDSVAGLGVLIDALHAARTVLEEHQVTHAKGDAPRWNTEPLYIPEDWQGDER
jgi:hypothetical protein